MSTAYRSATTAEERAGLASAADAIIATTNAMPWAGVLTAAGILVLSLVAWRGPIRAGVAAFGIAGQGRAGQATLSPRREGAGEGSCAGDPRWHQMILTIDDASRGAVVHIGRLPTPDSGSSSSRC